MAAGNTYVAIATQTLGSATASVTFSSIPSTYTDLVLVVNGAASAGDNIYLQFNGDTTTNYSGTYIYGDGTSAVSGRNTTTATASIGYLSTTQGSAICHIMNYANTTTYKTYLARWNGLTTLVAASVALWRKTPEAITSIKVGFASSTFNTGSTFSLYGILAA